MSTGSVAKLSVTPTSWATRESLERARLSFLMFPFRSSMIGASGFFAESVATAGAIGLERYHYKRKSFIAATKRGSRPPADLASRGSERGLLYSSATSISTAGWFWSGWSFYRSTASSHGEMNELFLRLGARSPKIILRSAKSLLRLQTSSHSFWLVRAPSDEDSD